VPERILAVDIGEARWGLAVSDELGLLAHPAGVLDARRDPLAELQRRAEALGVGRVVVGWPRRTDGGPADAAATAARWAEAIRRRTGLPVELWDERLTTRQAERLLVDQGRRRSERRQVVDEVAATLILQSFLDRRRRRSRDRPADDEARMADILGEGNGDTMAHDHDHEHLEDEVITLTDEDGHEHQFAILDVIEVDNKEYAILIPAGEEVEDEESEEEAVILRLETDETGEEILVDIEDDEEWQKVAQAWEELVDEEEEDEEEE
jgi:putative Holliday junction resolvase